MEENEVGTSDAADLIESMLTDDGDLVGHEPTEPVVEERSEEVTTEEEEEEQEESEEEQEEEESEESEEESEEEPNPVIDDETLVDIQIGEDTYEVNFAELREGYLRNEEYVNRVAALEQEHNEKAVALELKESELEQELLMAQVMISGDLSKYEKINWEQLKVQDPDTYKAARLEAMEAKERVEALQGRRAAIQAMHNEAQRLRHQAHLESQYKLAEKLIPEFAEDSAAFFNKIVAFAATVGYSKEEVSSIADARQLVLLNNARLHAESVVRKKEAVEKKLPKDLPPVVKPGQTKANDSGKRKATSMASKRMQSEKSVDAAAAYLMTLDL